MSSAPTGGFKGGEAPLERIFVRCATLAKSPSPEELTRAVLVNEDFRRVLRTDTRIAGAHTQQVAMCVHDETGMEVHNDTAQYFLVKSGRGKAVFAEALTGGGPVNVGLDPRGDEVLVPVETNPEQKVRVTHVSVIGPGSAWLVEPGTYHNVIVSEDGAPPLKLLTIYYPPHHPPFRVDRTHEEAVLREKTNVAE